MEKSKAELKRDIRKLRAMVADITHRNEQLIFLLRAPCAPATGAKIGSVAWDSDAHCGSAIETARLLRHVVIVVPENKHLLHFYAVPLSHVKP